MIITIEIDCTTQVVTFLPRELECTPTANPSFIATIPMAHAMKGALINPVKIFANVAVE